MKRSNVTAIVTGVSVGIAGLFAFVARTGYDMATNSYTHLWLPAWEESCQEVTAHNDFWKSAGGDITGDRVWWVSPHTYRNSAKNFAADIYTTYLEPRPVGELLQAAHERLMNAEVEYNISMLEPLDFIDPITGSTPGALLPTSEFLVQLNLYNEQGLEAVVKPFPPAPTKPVYWMVTAYNWLAVFPRWLVAWSIMSGLFYAIYALCAKSVRGVYNGVVHEGGEWFARLVMFVEMMPLLIMLGAGELALDGINALSRGVSAASKNAIKTWSEARRDLKHPNRKQIRQARRLLKRLEQLGAAPKELADARHVLEGWSVTPTMPQEARRVKPDPREQKLRVAKECVARLGAELLCDRDPLTALSGSGDEALREATREATNSRPATQRTRTT